MHVASYRMFCIKLSAFSFPVTFLCSPHFLYLFIGIFYMVKLRHVEIFVSSPGSCVGGEHRFKVLVPPAGGDEPLCLLRGAIH